MQLLKGRAAPEKVRRVGGDASVTERDVFSEPIVGGDRRDLEGEARRAAVVTDGSPRFTLPVRAHQRRAIVNGPRGGALHKGTGPSMSQVGCVLSGELRLPNTTYVAVLVGDAHSALQTFVYVTTGALSCEASKVRHRRHDFSRLFEPAAILTTIKIKSVSFEALVHGLKRGPLPEA